MAAKQILAMIVCAGLLSLEAFSLPLNPLMRYESNTPQPQLFNSPLSATSSLAYPSIQVLSDSKSLLGFADTLVKATSGNVLQARVVQTLVSLRRSWKPNVRMLLIKFLLAQKGLTIEGIIQRNPTDMATIRGLSSAQLFALKGILFETSIDAYYDDALRPFGLALCDLLLLDKSIDAKAKAQLSKSVIFYASKLSVGQVYSIDINLPRIEGTEDKFYRPTNPSIVAIKDGYVILLRAVNYRLGQGAKQESLSNDKIFRSRYYRLLLDTNLQPKALNEISLDGMTSMLDQHHDYTGIEDARLVVNEGRTWFTASTRAVNDPSISRMVLGTLAMTATQPDHRVPVLSAIALAGPDPGRSERNWLPFSIDNALVSIYSLGPNVVLNRLNTKPGEGSGKWDPLFNASVPFDASRFHNSAGPLSFTVNGQAGLLCVVHEGASHNNESVWHIHRFVWLDANLMPQRLSRPFYFIHKGVEQCTGMSYAHFGNNILLTVTLDDSLAHIVSMTTNDVESLLLPVTPL